MVSVSCHCENVVLEFAKLPSYIRDCDCPMCNRLGALWGDFLLSEVIVSSTIPTKTYEWGNGDYVMHHCPQCGCSTHYTPTQLAKNKEIVINLRMLARKELEQIPIDQA